jgi:hypothetical protein
MANDAEPAEDQKISFSWTEVIKYLIAIAALVGFSWFIIYLIGKTTNASELEWTRAVYLLSGVEAVAFAAAGFIFGREVNRQRAEKAEQRASKSELENIESLKKATAFEIKGDAIATAIRTKWKGLEKRAKVPETFKAGTGHLGTRLEFDELKELADHLFPQA